MVQKNTCYCNAFFVCYYNVWDLRNRYFSSKKQSDEYKGAIDQTGKDIGSKVDNATQSL